VRSVPTRPPLGGRRKLAHGIFWTEVTEICESAIGAPDLGYEDADGHVSGDDILDDIATQGFELLKELHPSEVSIHSNLQAWYPRHGYINHDVPPPMPGWETPIWHQQWVI